MKNYYSLLLIFSLLFFSSCAKKIVLTYQDSAVNTGTIHVKPVTPIHNCDLVLDDQKLIDKKFAVKEVTIQNVPAGNHDLSVSSDSWMYRDDIQVEKELDIQTGKTAVEKIERPKLSRAYYVYVALIMFVMVLTYTA